MPWPRVAAWALALLTVLVMSAGLAGVAVGGRPVDALTLLLTACVVGVSTVLGLVVAARQPRNVVATLLCLMATVFALSAFGDTYGPAEQRRPDALPRLPDALASVLMVSWVWLYLAVALLILFFPDGRLPRRSWRWVVLGLVTVTVAIHVVMIASPGRYDAPYGDVEHPLGRLDESTAAALRAVLFVAFIALMLASTWSVWVRFRRGDAVLRAQLKWFTIVVLVLPMTVALSWIGFWLWGTHGLAMVGYTVLFAGLPAVTAIAILRHDLYDVDRAVSAALAYGTASTGLVAVFAAVSFGAGAFVGDDSGVLAAAVTVAVGLALIPLFGRLRRTVDRRAYPMRAAALDAITDLTRGIDTGRAAPEQLEHALQNALADPALRIGFLLPGGTDLVDVHCRPLSAGVDPVPVMLGAQRIGTLSSAGPASRHLLTEVADASALLVEVVRLRLESTRALREARSSRARLQRVGYEERRRLERDLHDGAQQRLVSLGMALRLAQRHLDDGTVDVGDVLDESVAELGTAVAELRQLAHGLRPSCLDDGLYPALSSLVDSVPLPVELIVSAGQAVPDDIATTAYYVVSEAVANAMRHGDPATIGLSVVQDGDRLNVRVEDDGRGGAVLRPGSGLAGVQDRVAAAGGVLNVLSPLGAGTVVEAVLPCVS